MITGFNTDVKHSSKVYHVQTEDKGRNSGKIESLVYVGGEILDSYQTSYELNKDNASEEQIMELLEGQHKRVIRMIKTGKYDSSEPFPNDVLTDRSLDDVILEYLNSEQPSEQMKLVIHGLLTVRRNTVTHLKVETKQALSGLPIKESQVRVKLAVPDKPALLLDHGRTDENGLLLCQINMPDYPETLAALVVQAHSEYGTAEQKFPLRA